MTVPPSASLEQILAQHGDILYRVALLLAGEEGRAVAALRAAVRLAARSSQFPLDADNLLRQLLRVLAQHQRRRRVRRYAADAPLYRGPALASPFESLPFAQRRTLGLHLLLGYDLRTVAELIGASEEETRTTVAAAITGLAAASGTVLPDATPTELCPTVRTAVMRAPEQLTTDPALRGHLALCSACRAFDSAWNGLVRQTEAALRGTLRPYTLPADLVPTFVRDARPAASLIEQVLAGGKLGLTLVPLGVLVLIAALVLPGFWRSPTATQLPAAGPLAEPRALVQQALAQVTHPPAGNGVWHAQWETLWFFPDGKYAPLYADAWLDSYNPARHRLQVVHGAGGALYELQVGDGAHDLWYALSPTYYSTLYGANTAAPNAPQLIHRTMDVATQQRAAVARLASGAWDVGPSYLRQAYSAPDLRTLGRQLDGTHAVQILRFTGISPLGLPPDDPQNSLKDVTVLLALDSADGRLRSVTELSGPPGSEQTSRVTWRLRSEEWLTTERQAGEVFDANRAWNGLGKFSSEVQGASADDTLLLYSQSTRTPLEQLFDTPLPLPALPPPGTERALLANPDSPEAQGQWPPALRLTYLGQGRHMTLTWRNQQAPAGASGQANPQVASISAARGQHYLLMVQPVAPHNSFSALDVVIDASGYTRAEVLAVAQSIRPLDLESWRAQQALFADNAAVDPQAHAAIIAALAHVAPPGLHDVLHRRERHYAHHDLSVAELADPYHRAPHSGRPEITIDDQWVRADDAMGTFAMLTQQQREDGTVYASTYLDHNGTWTYYRDSGLLERWSWPIYADPLTMGTGTAAALELLAHPGEGVTLSTTANGMRTISRTAPIEQTSHFFWATSIDPSFLQSMPSFSIDTLPDLPTVRPLRIQTEIVLLPTGEPRYLRYTALGAPGSAPLLLEEWTFEPELPATSAAPSELSGTPPANATFVNDNGPKQAIGSTRTATISESITLARSPLFLPPAGGPLQLDVAERGNGYIGGQGGQEDTFLEAVIRNLAVRLSYNLTTNAYTTGFTLFQGPAASLRAFLQSRLPRWTVSKPVRVAIAGRDVDAWLLRGSDTPTTHVWLVAEIDGTLLVAEGDDPGFSAIGLPLLASLQRAN